MIRYTRHIGIFLLTIFTVSLVFQSGAKAHHLFNLDNSHTHTERGTDCHKKSLTTSDASHESAEWAQPQPSQEKTKTTVNVPCHTSLYLMQPAGTILSNPTDGNIFSNRIVSIFPQLFISPASDPPQYTS
ncbi:hypothetical protein [Fodinibius salsisoli]|uniref:Uncharacterized protein n=1 Tax=Fodinibius salsisoli TaxID=2820877 RepID=A0ABT3PS56_9BACT|nr:hypothetical protein [Fodinibius salsisoli]MCW9708689.1 hypothetical protein [Fodinibius salsisoli]